MVGEYDRLGEIAQQGNEFRRAETVMPDFDDVADRASVEFIWQQFEKPAEIRRIEFLRRSKLPEQGPEMIAQFRHAGIEEPLDLSLIHI